MIIIIKRTDFQTRCPYNQNHQMPQSKLLFHISKGCKDKADKAHLFEHCPYNYLHVIRKEEIQRHLVNCKSKPQLGTLQEQKEQSELLNNAIKTQFSKSSQKDITQEQILKNNQAIPGLQCTQAIEKTKKKRIRVKKNNQPINEDYLQEQDELPEWENQIKVVESEPQIINEPEIQTTQFQGQNEQQFDLDWSNIEDQTKHNKFEKNRRNSNNEESLILNNNEIQQGRRNQKRNR